MSRLSTAILAALLVVSPESALAQAGGPQALTLADAMQRAVSSSPTIAAARLQHPIDVAGVAVAGERPNPDISYEAAKETPRQSIGATLPVELGGKRQHRIDVAKSTVAVGDAELARTVTDVRREVRRVYFEAVAANLRMQMADDLRGLGQRARDAANARVIAGDVPRSDLTLADLALANAENDVTAAKGEADAVLAELNTLIGQPPNTSWTLSDPLSSGALVTTQQAGELAARANTDVQVIDRQIDEQVAKVDLAKAMTVPDVSVGGAFTYDAEPEFRYGWRFTGGVTIPVFTTHKAGVAVEQATLARLRQEREAIVARIAGSVSAALSRAAAARDQLTRYQTVILPLALEAERQAQAAYNGGQMSLPILVQALMTARDTRQRGLQAGLDYQHALTELERAMGSSLP
jgi:outer membrane protein, heavy metal efflux system